MSNFLDKYSKFLLLLVVVLTASCTNDLRRDITDTNAQPDSLEQSQIETQNADPNAIFFVGNQRYYSTQDGDTLQSIADRFGEDPTTLSQLNDLGLNQSLAEGEIIRLSSENSDTEIIELSTETQSSVEPAQNNFQSNFFRHEVQRGETIYTISNLYDVSVPTIADWNKLGADFAIAENDILLIPAPELLSFTQNEPELVLQEVVSTEVDTQPLNTEKSSPTVASERVEDTPQIDVQAESIAVQESETLEAQTQDEVEINQEDQLQITSEETSAPSQLIEPIETAELAESNEPNEEVDVNCNSFQPKDLNFILPVGGTLLKEFGIGGNKGIDIGAEGDESVYSVGKGEVQLVKKIANDTTVILILHQCNIYSVYQNISNVTLVRGERVVRGQLIGTIDNKFDYLHYEIRDGADPKDPQLYLPNF